MPGCPDRGAILPDFYLLCLAEIIGMPGSRWCRSH